ncbi:MAG: hypothetical protein M9958_01790 [Chitinophagales bacterium]|nr:hypothetical protein [Chitinophagales bacterium]
MKHLNFITIVLLLLTMLACNKDKKTIIDEGKDDDRNIRILRVDYINKVSNKTISYIYKYDSLGKLIRPALLRPDSIEDFSIKVVYNENSIKFIYLDGFSSDQLWHNTHITFDNDKVEEIEVETPFNLHTPHIAIAGKLGVFRNNNNQLDSIKFIYGDIPATSYFPLETKVTAYNSYGLPITSQSLPSQNTFTLYRDNDPIYFKFDYVRGEGIPSMLKRLVNEEFLQLNKYGVTNNDKYIIKYNGISNSYGAGRGEGNWLVSFGLPQYYILSKRSTHIVSKRIADVYKIKVGEEVFEKTIVDEFPYIHDTSAKTLEIGGLKIWYEFDEIK